LAETHRDLWVFAEQRHGRLMNVSRELLGGARTLADRLRVRLGAVLLGSGLENASQELVAYGADTVYVADNTLLEHYRSEAYSSILADLINLHHPDILLLGSTSIGRDLAPKTAARVSTGLTADCVKLDLDEEGILLQIVPAFGGKVMAEVVCPKHRPQMATIRPGVLKSLQPDSNRSGQIVNIPVSMKEDEIKVKILEIREETKTTLPLESAEVVVTGGYGVGSIEDWKLVENLADTLGGAVGATRPPVDEGWAFEEQMIGQSGKTVKPNLYVGLGISGAMQHVVGVQDSRFIVVINNDPTAPIFEFADVGIVADLREFVPHVIEEMKQRRSGSSK
jgi:electron transfer flavoprotein alpha subunit